MASLHSYHCLCTEYIFTTTSPLNSSPTRKTSADKAHILPVSLAKAVPAEHPDGAVVQLLAVADRKAALIRREDGFEYRYEVRCPRCKLAVGYRLDESQFEEGKGPGGREDVLFVLPGAVTTTEEVREKI
jgi:hypothetical protein